VNIFFLHPDAEKCAEHMCDEHILKCLPRYVELLEQVHRVDWEKEQPTSPELFWLRQSALHYHWLAYLCSAMIWEHGIRFRNLSKFYQTVNNLRVCVPAFKYDTFIDPPFTLGAEHQDSVFANRAYYLTALQPEPQWTVRSAPGWYQRMRYPIQPPEQTW
jgi:hypothetical protein